MKNNYLLALVLVSFIFRYYMLINSNFIFYSDDAIYASLARFFYEGNYSQAIHPTWPPFYPFISSLLFGIFDNWEQTLRLVSVISGSLILVPLYFIARKFMTDKPSLLLVVLASLTTPFITYSLMPYSDMLSALLLFTAIALLINKKLYTSGLFFGLTYLTRPEGLMFFYLSVIFLLLTKSKPKKMIIFVTIFILTISPYAFVMKERFSSWSLSHKASAQLKQGQSFQVRNGSTWSQEVVSIKSPNYDSHYFRGGGKHVIEHSDFYWFLFKERLAKWGDVLQKNISKLYQILIFIGLIASLKKKNHASVYLILLLIPSILATIIATPISNIRYLMWTIPLFLIFTFTLFKKKTVLIPLILTLFLPLFGSHALLNPKEFVGELEKLSALSEIKIAGEKIKSISKINNPKIMARHEGFEFYAEGETIYIPQDKTNEELISYGMERNANYLIAWQNELQDLNFPLEIEFELKIPRRLVIYSF